MIRFLCDFRGLVTVGYYSRFPGTDVSGSTFSFLLRSAETARNERCATPVSEQRNWLDGSARKRAPAPREIEREETRAFYDRVHRPEIIFACGAAVPRRPLRYPLRLTDCIVCLPYFLYF